MTPCRSFKEQASNKGRFGGRHAKRNTFRWYPMWVKWKVSASLWGGGERTTRGVSGSFKTVQHWWLLLWTRTSPEGGTGRTVRLMGEDSCCGTCTAAAFSKTGLINAQYCPTPRTRARIGFQKRRALENSPVGALKRLTHKYTHLFLTSVTASGQTWAGAWHALCCCYYMYLP